MLMLRYTIVLLRTAVEHLSDIVLGTLVARSAMPHIAHFTQSSLGRPRRKLTLREARLAGQSPIGMTVRNVARTRFRVVPVMSLPGVVVRRTLLAYCSAFTRRRITPNLSGAVGAARDMTVRG
jgi:hypothetical protein